MKKQHVQYRSLGCCSKPPYNTDTDAVESVSAKREQSVLSVVKTCAGHWF